jgi:hypothetical protein
MNLFKVGGFIFFFLGIFQIIIGLKNMLAYYEFSFKSSVKEAKILKVESYRNRVNRLGVDYYVSNIQGIDTLIYKIPDARCLINVKENDKVFIRYFSTDYTPIIADPQIVEYSSNGERCASIFFELIPLFIGVIFVFLSKDYEQKNFIKNIILIFNYL